MNSDQNRSIGVFALVMINFAAVVSIRSLPSMAPYGLSMVFFYLLATLGFLIPCALVSAELASAFPENCGLYHWVSLAMGKKVGFFSIWLQNANNFICFPATLSFVASTLAYGIFPQFTENKTFTLVVILAIIWVSTIAVLHGMRLTSAITAIGSIIGTLLPVILIVILGMSWLILKKCSQVTFSYGNLIPDLSSPENVSLLLGVFLAFSGLEMSANHISDVVNPRKNYPRAIFLSAILILAISVFGSLAIAIVVPRKEIMMHAGVMQAVQIFFSAFRAERLIPWLSLAIALGSIAWFCAWVSGPARALHTALSNSNLPAWLTRLNKHNMPTAIMLIQAVAASILSCLFIFAESINAAFWMLTNVAAQLCLLMYVLLFLAGIVLKFKYPETPRMYSVPFGKFGMTVIAGASALICAIFYLIGFFPPIDIGIHNKTSYFFTILAMNIAVGVLPYWVLLKCMHKKNV